jgi:divalent metal cation (Fe/Co/Zn/Cd) transporter
VAHRRKPLRLALVLNTAVLVVELGAGIGTSSLSLVIDSVHNLSDELGIGLLFLAYTLRAGLSGARAPPTSSTRSACSRSAAIWRGGASSVWRRPFP